MRAVKRLIAVFAVLMLPSITGAALPLITDDTFTQGTGKLQFEAGGEYDRDKETVRGSRVRETDHTVTSTLAYGAADRVDIFAGLSYQRSVRTGDVMTTEVNGISDTLFGAKWRFYEKEGLSFAAKPVVSMPTGNDEKGLGSGKIDYGAYVIASKVSDPWEVHLNLGYVRNENKIDERKDIWHASLAMAYTVTKSVKLCADIGADTNRDMTSEIEPAYLLGGAIFSVRDNLDISFGVKAGLNRPETDWAFLPGVTYRF
jgi:hypothetical protein